MCLQYALIIKKSTKSRKNINYIEDHKKIRLNFSRTRFYVEHLLSYNWRSRASMVVAENLGTDAQISLNFVHTNFGEYASSFHYRI